MDSNSTSYHSSVETTRTQAKPSPVNPALHAHVKEPSVSLHAALVSQSCVFREHSSMLLQSPAAATPVLLYPTMHAHVKEPSVSVQFATGSQLCVSSAHSSILKQSPPTAMPVSAYPALHAQVNEPCVLAHVALTSQLCHDWLFTPPEHSSTSTHLYSQRSDPVYVFPRHTPEPATQGQPYMKVAFPYVKTLHWLETSTTTSCAIQQSALTPQSSRSNPAPLNAMFGGVSHSTAESDSQVIVPQSSPPTVADGA
mmetsp:Transcript_20939/g.50564  ORF Transcript_20939/g.50564 Transcript_20939/m.50564 type:complete len:254 (+) Transcript_20939:1-762(+)